MEFPVESAALQNEQPVPVFPGKHVALDFKAVDAHLVATPLGRHEVLEEGQVLLEPVVLILEVLYLGGELGLRGLLDLEPRLAGVDYRAQPPCFTLQARHGFTQPCEIVFKLATIEPRESPPRVVRPRSHSERKGKKYQHPHSTPVPGHVCPHRHPW